MSSKSEVGDGVTKIYFQNGMPEEKLKIIGRDGAKDFATVNSFDLNIH